MSEKFIKSISDVCKQTTPKHDICQEAFCVHNLFYIKIGQWLEVTGDIIAIISLILLVRTRQFRKLNAIVNPSLRLIGATGLGFYALGITFSLFIHIYFKFRSFVEMPDPCSYLWSPISCLSFRLPVYYAFVGFNMFHIMLSLERARVLFRRYSTDDVLFGQIAVIIMLTLPIVFIIWTFHDDDFISLRPYCSLHSNETVYNLMTSGFVLLASDVATTILDIIVYFYNRKQLERKLRGYNLSRTFRLKETQISMRLVFPFAIIHSIMYFFFMIAIIIGTYFILKLDTHQATPALQILGLFKVVYLTGVPALVLIFRFNQAKKTDEWLVKQDYAEIYFQQFKSQIK